MARQRNGPRSRLCAATGPFSHIWASAEMCGPVNYLRSARTTSTIITMTTTVPMPIYMRCPFISVSRPPNCPPPVHPNPVSAQRVGYGVGEGRGRAPDQAAQVPGGVEHLAPAQAEVGVGEDVRQL